MAERLEDRFARLHRRHVGAYSIVSLDPPIFYVRLPGEGLDEFIAQYHLLFSALQGRRVYCLCCYSWNLTPHVLDAVTRLESQCKGQFPDIRLIHLCNEPGQAEQFQARGAEAVFCNKNCFLDEAIFRPLRGIETKCDAVYDARISEFKRHFLAREVESLGLIYYRSVYDDPQYIREVREQLPQAHYFNHPDSGAYRPLSSGDINLCLNACRVGLCLSAEEGAMLASTRYLLSGLPIVTTPSQGGRDVFYEDGFVLTVPPEPQEVRRAVEELVARKPLPEAIRQATLEKMHRHRRTFIELVQDIYDRNRVPRRFAEEWSQVFRNRMIENRSHLETIAKVHAADAARAG